MYLVQHASFIVCSGEVTVRAGLPVLFAGVILLIGIVDRYH